MLRYSLTFCNTKRGMVLISFRVSPKRTVYLRGLGPRDWDLLPPNLQLFLRSIGHNGITMQKYLLFKKVGVGNLAEALLKMPECKPTRRIEGKSTTFTLFLPQWILENET